MTVTFDKSVNVMRILFSDAPIEESDEVEAGVIIDYALDGSPVGIEILDADQRIENPYTVEYRDLTNAA